MRFGVLGPLVVGDGDREVPVAAGKQAALLADLLLHANRTLSLSRLVDDLWGEEAPASAVKAVQVYVSKLRKALPVERLQTRGAGYVLAVEDDELDLAAFATLAADGHAALGIDDERAAALLGEALALWRGPALAGIDAPFAAVEAPRLEELRLVCDEDRLEALLGLGRPDQVVSELEALAARHPLRERPRTLLMLALYRAGRQADALATYASFRHQLDDELGIEPSPSLRELERQILNQDPALERAAPQSARLARPTRTPPREATTELLERRAALDALDAALARARDGSGVVALVVGEAGVGKSTLVEHWVSAARAGARVLTGSCDPLLTPRALGPFRDIAQEVGGQLAEALADDGGRDAVLDALLDELSAEPTVLVVEDVHWADEASLDVVSLLGRRIARLPAVLVATTRPEGLAAGTPLLGSLGELPAALMVRVDLEPLSPAGVEELARAAGRPAEGLHEKTGGNPFFVTEILAGTGTTLPPSVRAAVLARCGRLSSSARPVIDVVSVMPGRAELSLVTEVVGPAGEEIEECLAAEILTSDGANLRFRHEIARVAVESELSPPRRAELEAAVLSALERRGRADLARAVHHARLAGDDEAVRRLAPAAGREAAAAGAHREAAEHYRAAVGLVTDREPAERAALLEALSVEAYLADIVEDALAARGEAVELRRALGDRIRTGDGLRWLARLRWWSGDGAGAHEAAAEAVDVLEPEGPSRELAMALSGLSQLEGLAWRPAEAIALAERALELARTFGDDETVVHALTNIGIAKRLLGDAAGGRASLEEAFERASTAGFHDHAGRALAALVSSAVELRDTRLVEADLDRSLRYLERHNLDGYRRYALGIRAAWRVEHGDPAAAELDALESLRGGDLAGITAHPGRLALARVQMRRGDRAAAETLEPALRLARSSNELQRLGPATAALAELAWLDGRLEDVLDDVDEVFRASVATHVGWTAGELAFWLWVGGRLTRAPDAAPPPHRLLVEGRWREAAAELEALGMPYQQALALAQGGTSEARAEAISLFERCGAPAAAARLRQLSAGDASPAAAAASAERTLATLVVTDLVDSTAALSRVGDRAWADLIDRHDGIVREELERHAGTEIDSAGDGFLVAFEEPARAIQYGRAIVARVESLDLRVRVGIHTGEIERRGHRARGVAVHLAARVAACAGPGEVLVTGTTRDLVAGSGLAFTDRGKHELKGIERPRRLFALES